MADETLKNKKVFHTPQEVLELFQQRGLKPTFCVVPFTNAIFNPGGNVSVCRQKGTGHTVGTLKENTFEEIWNNDYMREWRRQFLEDDVKICKNEQSRDACHLSASNYHFFDSVAPKIIQGTNLLKVTANFNGKCNLECKMCHIWQMENGFYDLNNFWDKAEKEFFPYIKEIELLSGEPFIQKDTYKLIEKIVPINPDCQWAFTTNAHWKLNSRIKQDLDRIIIKNIIISVDSLNKERFESIRKNGSFDFLLENIFNLKKYSDERVAAGRSDLGLTIHFTAMRENFLDALDILDFCEAHAIRHSFKTLLVPEELSVLTLPYQEQQATLIKFIEKASSLHLKRGIRVIRPLLEKMNPVDRACLYDIMFEKMKSG